MNHIISLDLATNYYLKKPSSGWVLAGLTNITYIITQMKKVPLGAAIELPSYIKNSKSMYSLTNNYKREAIQRQRLLFSLSKSPSRRANKRLRKIN